MTYGQTGSGKTFTMTGDSGNFQVSDHGMPWCEGDSSDTNPKSLVGEQTNSQRLASQKGWIMHVGYG